MRSRDGAVAITRGTPIVARANAHAEAARSLMDGMLTPQPWSAEALCAQTDPEAFFPEKGGSTRDAKRICAECPVRDECLRYALDHDVRFGIWGGLSERERRRVKKGLPPRPSKQEAKRRQWSAAEDRQLRALVEGGALSNVQIAAVLGRAVKSVHKRREALGLPRSEWRGGVAPSSSRAVA